MLKNEKYEEYQIYYSEKDREIKEIARLILDNNYKVLEKYKDTERNFVAKIEVKGKIFVLKSPKAETVIPQRKFQTLWKKGEALNSLYNLDKYRDDGLNYFIVPRAVMVKRVFFIEASYILMDYEEGDILSTSEDIDEV
ncbi:MAG: lipopolysaccharide core heptose(II) kinase RfaY, partial [Fusobacteriaceae bacterium]